MSGAIPTGYGRTFLIGGAVVASGLSGFYMNMLRNKRRQEEAGTNPYFEQVIAAVSEPIGPGQELPQVGGKQSINPPAFRRTDHHNGHTTLSNYKNSPEYAESGAAMRRMAPPPQRQGTDGTGRVYTKSPDYTSNYGKTNRPTAPANVQKSADNPDNLIIHA